MAGSRPRRLGAPFSIQACQLVKQEKGVLKKTGKMEKMEKKKWMIAPWCEDGIPKKQLARPIWR